MAALSGESTRLYLSVVLLDCPWLDGSVELTEERALHIDERHPDLEGRADELIAATLADPDQGLRSSRTANVRKFVRQFQDELSGRHMIVVVVTEDSRQRHWVVTAYAAKRLSKRGLEWSKQ